MPEIVPAERIPQLQPDIDVLPSTEPAPRVRRTWYHTTLWNACVIGMVGFMAPGLWNAMNSLGAGGAQEPYLVNAANALVFGIMGFLCLFGGPIANRIGLSWTLVLGAVGYPVYSAGLYCNNRFGNEWFVLVGAVACGFSAGIPRAGEAWKVHEHMALVQDWRSTRWRSNCARTQQL
jgi:MFS family permease